MNNLFQIRNFTSAAGLNLTWKIECDALTEDDWKCIAHVAMMELPRFGQVIGVPTGGYRLAEAFRPFKTIDPGILIVDDVWTTGKSMHEHAYEMGLSSNEWVGYVAFARGDLPPNVRAFCKLLGGP